MGWRDSIGKILDKSEKVAFMVDKLDEYEKDIKNITEDRDLWKHSESRCNALYKELSEENNQLKKDNNELGKISEVDKCKIVAFERIAAGESIQAVIDDYPNLKGGE